MIREQSVVNFACARHSDACRQPRVRGARRRSDGGGANIQISFTILKKIVQNLKKIQPPIGPRRARAPAARPRPRSAESGDDASRARCRAVEPCPDAGPGGPGPPRRGGWRVGDASRGDTGSKQRTELSIFQLSESRRSIELNRSPTPPFPVKSETTEARRALGGARRMHIHMTCRYAS